MTGPGTSAWRPPVRNPGPPTAALPTSAAPMWWAGGERAITAREKATIEEHGPSCYTIPLLPVQAVDPEDPWRGLYLPARMPAPSEYGDLTHPDIPLWPDDREDALDKLVHAQGFDFHIVAGDFTEEAMEDGDELYWQELRAWNPEAPDGEWRLAWKGDTEDGPYAWFVRPMALRPEPTTPPVQGINLGAGVRAIADERQRQVHTEGFSAENDANYEAGVLANAALAYLQVSVMDLAAGGRAHIATGSPPACWPWHRLYWKPRDARRDLVRAGALIAAQLDVIDSQRDAAPGVGNG